MINYKRSQMIKCEETQEILQSSGFYTRASIYVYRGPWRVFKGYLDVASSKRKYFQFPNFYMSSFGNWSAWKQRPSRLSCPFPCFLSQSSCFHFMKERQCSQLVPNKHCCNCWECESNYNLVTHSLPFMWLPILSSPLKEDLNQLTAYTFLPDKSEIKWVWDITKIKLLSHLVIVTNKFPGLTYMQTQTPHAEQKFSMNELNFSTKIFI